MEKLLDIGNVFAIPEVRDIEKEFPGKEPFLCVLYNNFFSHPFAEQRLADYNKQNSFKFKAIKNSLALFDTLFRKETQFHYLFRNGHLYHPEIQRAIWPVLAAKGCVYNCSYCAVRKGRGRYTSKPSDSVLSEVQTGINKGYNRMLFIGDELGTYGIDLRDGTSLSNLLQTFLSDECPIRVGIWYLDAFRLKEVAPVLEKLAQKDKIFFLGITLQNGSKRILDLMNRRYSIDDIMDVVLKLRKYPAIIIATQFMVGFPTETEQDFLETLALVEKGCFDLVEVYEYSPRPGTRAAKMTDDVPAHVKNERAKVLRKLASKKGRTLFLRHVANEFKR
jgi:MiaB/RimO family radical SAM methylthiotransferase